MKINIIIVSHVCSSSLLRVYWYVWCSMSFLFEYMCTRLPLIWWFIAGVPSSQALPGYLITASSCVCVPDVIVAQMRLKLSAIDVTAKAVFERFYLFPGLKPEVFGIKNNMNPSQNSKMYQKLVDSVISVLYVVGLTVADMATTKRKKAKKMAKKKSFFQTMMTGKTRVFQRNSILFEDCTKKTKLSPAPENSGNS